MLGLHPMAKLGLEELRAGARRQGLKFTVTSKVRSIDRQFELFKLHAAGDPRQRLPVAIPGRSTHNYGLAVDLVADGGRQAELAKLAQSIGWTWAGPRDPVHFQVATQAAWSQALRIVFAGARPPTGTSIPAPSAGQTARLAAFQRRIRSLTS